MYWGEDLRAALVLEAELVTSRLGWWGVGRVGLNRFRERYHGTVCYSFPMRKVYDTFLDSMDESSSRDGHSAWFRG